MFPLKRLQHQHQGGGGGRDGARVEGEGGSVLVHSMSHEWKVDIWLFLTAKYIHSQKQQTCLDQP